MAKEEEHRLLVAVPIYHAKVLVIPGAFESATKPAITGNCRSCEVNLAMLDSNRNPKRDLYEIFFLFVRPRKNDVSRGRADTHIHLFYPKGGNRTQRTCSGIVLGWVGCYIMPV